MTFTCAVCGQTVTIPNVDKGVYRKRKWECNLCYSVIVRKRYKVNRKGAVTLFSPVNSALGDQVVDQVTRERYRRDNPDETVIDLSLVDADEAVRLYRPKKFFWASTTQYMEQPKNFEVQIYSVPVEANWLAKEGIYPQFDIRPEDHIDVGMERFAVLNFRNIIKCKWKNAEPFLVNSVLIHLQKYVNSGELDGAVVVGNDDRDPLVYWPEWALDYRKKLEIPQIAALCSRSRLYVGKDCGVAHLAAASGAMNMVVWGYFEPQWIIKTYPERFIAINKKDSAPARLAEAIDERMQNDGKTILAAEKPILAAV